jgi:hypothetical protein
MLHGLGLEFDLAVVAVAVLSAATLIVLLIMAMEVWRRG